MDAPGFAKLNVLESDPLEIGLELALEYFLGNALIRPIALVIKLLTCP